jgi:uncharacterized protein
LPASLDSEQNISFLDGYSQITKDRGAQAPLIMIQKELLEILACPRCKGPVALNEKLHGIVCTSCHLLYEIRDDIPIMLIDEAKPLQDT